MVVTDLTSFAISLVGYRLGDIAAYSPTPCKCGRPFPALARVLGRSNDVIRTPSGKVSVYSFTSVLFEHPVVRQYQIDQLSDHSLLVKVVRPGRGCRWRT